MNDIKLLEYTTKEGTELSFLYMEDELWLLSDNLKEYFHLTTNKFLSIWESIKEPMLHPDQFYYRTMKKKDRSDAGINIISSGKVYLFNMNLLLAVLYRISPEEAGHLFGWVRATMKAEGKNYPGLLDADIVGRGRIYIQYGDMENAIFNTEVYFQNTYHPEWMQDLYVQKMIKDIDHAEVLDTGLIKSPVLGLIPPTELSGGVKTLILLYKDPSNVFNVSTCGDNCAKWVLDIARQHNLTINLRHIMDFGSRNFDVVILNNHEQVHNMAELVQYAGLFI